MAERTTVTLDRTPPQAPDIERAVLGSMLIDREAVGKAIELINEECFYKPIHQVLYRVLTDLYDRNIPIDQLTVAEHLRQRGQLDTIGGEPAIASLMNETGSSANIDYHCQILKEKSLLRKIITVTSSVQNMCFDEKANALNVMDTLEANVFQLFGLRHSKSSEPFSDIVFKAHKEILHKAEAKDFITGVDTGFTQLNKITGGWQKSDFIILAGRPSMGKTALALDLAKNAAAKNVPVGLFSLEMSSTQLVMRLLFNEARFDGSTLSTEKKKPEDWTRLNDACSRLLNYPVFIDDTPGLSSMELSAKAKRLKAEYNIGLIIVDYLQLMEGTSKESRQQEISSISRNLKGLAKELEIPVIALSQLSRALEQRSGDHRPQLADLRESGAIEQDADLVMFIYRASVYGLSAEYTILEEHIPQDQVAEVIIRKHRNGPIGTILLHWTKEHTRFGEFSYVSTDDYF
ncbi:replicative DNA helicase [bacterium]|nr:replicative DNA helicase [bacterium]